MYETIVGVVLSAILAFIAWLTVKVIGLETEIAKINATIQGKEKTCAEHHEWMQEQSTKTNQIAMDVAFLRGRFDK
jgi:hypothetical protein